jgi:glutathione S-transferase
MSTNIILLEARDEEELTAKKNSPFKAFVCARQDTLESLCKESPKDEFYQARRLANRQIHHQYISTELDEEFFKTCTDDYRGLADGMARLNELIVLPFAAGEEITYADLHIVPWLAHAMWGSGGVDVGDFQPLEKCVGKTVPGFMVGEKIKRWWANMGKRESFKNVYPKLH